MKRLEMAYSSVSSKYTLGGQPLSIKIQVVFIHVDQFIHFFVHNLMAACHCQHVQGIPTDVSCLVPEGIGLLLEEAKDQPGFVPTFLDLLDQQHTICTKLLCHDAAMEVHFDGGEPHARSIAIQGGVDVLGTASTEAINFSVQSPQEVPAANLAIWICVDMHDLSARVRWVARKRVVQQNGLVGILRVSKIKTKLVFWRNGDRDFHDITEQSMLSTTLHPHLNVLQG
mmetsp:Transcript_21595/g.45080  ORF Transcript_21595/g.45080 Transcript_21595/m.45080 type:complete len:227 (-) Transcript_21595:39-719(-)